MIPTLFGIMLLNFVIIQAAPGGPVEQIIAQLQGHGVSRDRALQRRRRRRGRRRRRRAARSAVAGKYRGAQGLDPELIKELEKQFGFDKPPRERFLLMMKQLRCASISARASSATARWSTWCSRRLPVSISLGLWTTLLVYLISIPLGIAKAVRDGSRFDVWTSAVVIVGNAIPGFLFAILLIVLFAGGSYCAVVSAARPRLGQLGAARLAGTRSPTTSGT